MPDSWKNTPESENNLARHIVYNDCCPSCGYHIFEGEELNVEGPEVTQECFCSCGAQWRDVYKLSRTLRVVPP